MDVINTVVYDSNLYNRLIYAAPVPRYRMVPGSVADAVAALDRDHRAVLHLHWEEAFVRWQADKAAAERAVDDLLATLTAYVGRGGHIVWTIHNALPHELEFTKAFLRLRLGLGQLADRILVHSRAAVPLVLGQFSPDSARIVMLPHPSYLGAYEDETATFALQPDWQNRRLLMFGKLRRYKGVETLLDALALAPGIEVAIIGEPNSGEGYIETLMPRIAAMPNVSLAAQRIDDADLPALLRAHRGVVLPYRRILTSGTALLAMTFGLPIVAPDLPQLREILPPSAWPLLYPADDVQALTERLELLAGLDDSVLRGLRDDLQARARHYSPQVVSERLFDLFDTL